MRKIPFSYIFFFLWVAFLLAGLYVYLAYLQPAKLSENINKFLSSKTSIVSSIESYQLSFNPSPSIIANNVIVVDKENKFIFKIAKIESNLNWRSLFVLKPIISKITITDPEYKILLPIKKEENTQEQPKIEEISQRITTDLFAYLEKFSIPHYFNSIKINVNNAKGSIVDLNTKLSLYMDNFNLDFKAPDILDGYAKINIDTLNLIKNKTILSTLTKTSIYAENISYSTKKYTGDFSFKTNAQFAPLKEFTNATILKEYQIFPMPEPSEIYFSSHFSILIPQKSIELSANFINNTILPVNGYNIPLVMEIPFELKTSFTPITPTTKHQFDGYASPFLKENKLAQFAFNLPGLYVENIAIKNAVIHADKDKATFNGNLTGLYPFNPLYYGNVKVDNFSLPRWIGPTRSISAGLYNALNKIKGDINVFCTAKSVYSPQLKASIPGYEVTGKAMTANFLKPDIRFDLILLQNQSQTTDLNPLFPEINGKNPGKVAIAPPVVFSSNNKIKIKKKHFFVDYHINISVPHNAHIWKLDFSQAQIEIAPDKNETPIINVAINDLYGGKALAKAALYTKQKHQISATVRNILLEAPIRSILGYTACTGKLNADTQIALTGSSFAELLNSLEIKANVDLHKPAFHSKTELIQKFNALKASINIKTLPFNTKRKLPEAFAFYGDWEVQSQTDTENYRLRSNGSSINFSTQNFSPVSRNPQKTDVQLLELPSRATILDGSTNFGFNLKDNSLIIQNYRGKLRNSKLIANLTVKTLDKKYWNGNLYFQHFNLADMIKKPKENQQTKEKDLPLNFICENVMDLNIKADRLTFYDITTTNFTGNIKIADNKISVNNLQTNIKQGKIQALLEGSVSHKEGTNKYSMNTLYKMKAENIDMLNVTKMRKQKTLMAGTGYVAFQGSAILSKTTDLFKTMNAKWNMQFSNGYFVNEKTNQTAEKQNNGIHADTENRQYGSKTNYQILQASGDVKNGIIHTNNIKLYGPGIYVQGGGKINLPQNTINAYASATYLGIPEIPIKVTGSLDKPKIDINVLTAVGYTLGNIGSSFFDVFNGFIIQPFKIIINQ